MRVEDYGSVVRVVPENVEEKRTMLETLEFEEWQWFGGGLLVEPRQLAVVLAAVGGMAVEEP